MTTESRLIKTPATKPTHLRSSITENFPTFYLSQITEILSYGSTNELDDLI